MQALSELLKSSPELFPFGLDAVNNTVSFIRLSRGDYEQASFLDARILTPRTERRLVPWPQAGAAVEAAGLIERCAFIFHIGHVGSTLMSRLIGAHRGAFGLREPMVLRTFAQLRGEPPGNASARAGGDFEGRLGGCLKLLSRTFEAHEIAVIKATSFVSELADELLARPSSPRALIMYVSPESYLATILGGPNSRQEAQRLAPQRLRRLQRRLGSDAWHPGNLSEGETLALAWACEVCALSEAAGRAKERVLWLDFDEFLANPDPPLLAALRHLEIEASAAEVAAILRGPLMGRYSKAPEHAYDSALRREVLNQARALHGAEIRRGLAWLNRAAVEFAPLRAAMQGVGANSA
jgi:hypothetical protein